MTELANLFFTVFGGNLSALAVGGGLYFVYGLCHRSHCRYKTGEGWEVELAEVENLQHAGTQRIDRLKEQLKKMQNSSGSNISSV